MATDKFKNVKVINVVSPEEAASYTWFKDGAAISKEKSLMVMPENRIPSDNNLLLPANFGSGDVLIRDIYEEMPTFVLATDCVHLWASKATKLSEILIRLGATRCTFKNSKVVTSMREKDASAEGQWKLVKADASYNHSIEEKLKNCYNLEFRSNEPCNLTKEEWEDIKLKAKASNLLQDATVRGLINMREPGKRNVTSMTYSFSALEEYNESTEIACNLGVGAIFNLKAQMKEQIHRVYEATMSYEIEF